MEQNSTDWHKWRLNGLGGSDAPVVMGESEHVTPYQLWLQKTTGVSSDSGNNFVTQLGHKFEPMMRAELDLDFGFSFHPQCVEHSEIKWLRASLDGLNEDNKIFAEIKYVGQQKINDLINEQKIHLPHWIQMQHQFMVTGYSKGIYAAYTLDENHQSIKQSHYITVAPDLNYITNILFPKLEEFWKMIQEQKPPALEKKDLVEIKDKDAIDSAKELIKLSKEQKEIEKKIKTIKESLLKFKSSKAGVVIDKVKITTVIRKGNVDYGIIPELKSVNLDQYRKPVSTYDKFNV